MTRRFHKMHGLGNDFAIFDAREEPLAMTEALARSLADRHTGIGCDQLIVIGPSDRADVRMRIWNHDGGEVESCGNAARCVVALTGAKTIETDGGLVGGAADGSEVEVAMGEPRFGWDEVPLAYAMDTAALPMAWGELERPMALSVGNPHLVFFVEDLEAVPIEGLGPLIEHDPAFPDRINVNVAEIGSAGIRLRTWERGAGLTLACGTGACATAVAAIASKRSASPVTVAMAGGSLSIAWAPGEPVRMRGPATKVFEGEIDLEGRA
ncbi:MAG TPA: diaminopimelate epimerase [Croceibacterium sp.]|nr:diaminopimelate epimerase [Croceibacterium sp.]